METNQTAPQTDPASDDAQGDSASTASAAGGAVGSASMGAGDAGADEGSTGAGIPDEPAPDATGPGFYPWLRRLGLPRRAGWLGGVCAGIGARLGIDPIIVRGIVVVVAVLGAPFVLLYAVAWLLLPDVEGRIHLERLTRGIVDPAVVGIAVMAVLGFIPLVQGGWLGWHWWDDWPVVSDPIFGFDLMVPLRIIWTLLVVGGIVALVIWLARRSSQTALAGRTAPDPQNPPAGGVGARTASAAAATAGAPTHGDTRASGADAASAQSTDAASASYSGATAGPGGAGLDGSTGAPAASAPSTEPPVPAMGADADAIAQWRAQHEAWRVAHAEWKSGQDQAMRAARAQAAAENREQARALAAQADAARAARRRSRPRASAAFVFTALGLALVGGAAVALWALGDPDVAAFAVPVALAAATLVLALGMVVAALRRRRSGALAFFTLMTTLAMLAGIGGATVATQGDLIGPNVVVDLSRSQRIVQPLGSAYLYSAATSGPTPVIELTQGAGDVILSIDGDDRVLLDAEDAGRLDLVVSDETGVITRPQLGGEDASALLLGGESGIGDPSDDERIDARVVLTQRTGTVYIQVNQ